MALLLLLFIAFMAVAFFLAVDAGRHAARCTSLQALAEGLEGGEATLATAFRGLKACSVHGRIEGRPVRVSFGSLGADFSVRLTAEVHHPSAYFLVEESQLLLRLGRWLGLAKDPLADPALALRAGDPAAVKLLQATQVHAALRQHFRLEGVLTISLNGPTLTCLMRLPRQQSEFNLRPVLEALVALARLCDRQPVAVGSHASLRFVWTAGAATPRCPYCRDELDPAAADGTLACDRCGTVHHRECLVEAGGCTVFGCGARATEADQART